jgi:GNAT superfamily N-acetyltransferase
MHDAMALPGFVALLDGVPAGLATYNVEAAECELVTLNSLVGRRGIGTALVEAVRAEAMAQSCRRLRLITTNDNTQALRFYQRHGFRLAALRPGAIDAARALKPEIPLFGIDNIPIRDEIELELDLR